MKSADQILGELHIQRRGSGGQFYTECPECSAKRKKKHQRTLSVTLTHEGVLWFCYHCPNAGGRFYDEDERGRGSTNGHQRSMAGATRKTEYQRRDRPSYGRLYGPMGR